jgi:RNA polymerase sigma-70 factor (ECF subfamily)
MGRQDVELMQRWQDGDPTAFEELVRRWQQPVARFLTRYAGRPERVADLCQEVFLRVYHAGPRYRPSGAFSTWLYRIALNVARDAARRRRHEPLPLRDHEPTVPADDRCERQETAAVVAQAVAELPEPLRVVLVLRHYEEMSFEEMARLLATPASTLKSRFGVALARLRDRLHPLSDHPEEPEP